jgi:hypothetical protein
VELVDLREATSAREMVFTRTILPILAITPELLAHIAITALRLNYKPLALLIKPAVAELVLLPALQMLNSNV